MKSMLEKNLAGLCGEVGGRRKLIQRGLQNFKGAIATHVSAL